MAPAMAAKRPILTPSTPRSRPTTGVKRADRPLPGDDREDHQDGDGRDLGYGEDVLDRGALRSPVTFR